MASYPDRPISMRVLNPARWLVLSLVLPLLAGQTATADTVYLCAGEGAGGSTLFSDKPCKSGLGQTLRFPKNYTSGEGLSALEQEQLRELEQREAEQQRQTIKLSPADTTEVPESAAAVTGETKPDPEACGKAEAALKDWGRIMSLGYLPEQEVTMQAELKNRLHNRDQSCTP